MNVDQLEFAVVLVMLLVVVVVCYCSYVFGPDQQCDMSQFILSLVISFTIFYPGAFGIIRRIAHDCI